MLTAGKGSKQHTSLSINEYTELARDLKDKELYNGEHHTVFIIILCS